MMCPDLKLNLCLHDIGMDISGPAYMDLSWEIRALLAWHRLTGERISWLSWQGSFEVQRIMKNLLLRRLKCGA